VGVAAAVTTFAAAVPAWRAMKMDVSQVLAAG
jgi:ABC-type lipoprotein release transport system permease subunit